MTGLTKRKIDATAPDPSREIRLWDDNPRGFGVRIKPSGVKSFFIQYRSPVTNKKVRHTLGQYGRLTLEQARKMAKALLSSVETLGADPAREKRLARDNSHSTANTVAEFCDDYIRDARAGLVTYRGRPKKTSTLDIDEGRVRRHVKPVLGSKLVVNVTTQDVTRLYHDIRTGKIAVDEKMGPRGRARVTGGATTAARTIDLFGSIMTYAIAQGLRRDNPVTGFKRPPPKTRDRILSPDEYGRLGEALDLLEAKGSNPIAIRVIRVLALSGCRRNEIQALRKDAIDAHHQCLRLADTKSGQQVRPIGRAALDVLKAAPIQEGSPWTFPAATGDGYSVDVKVFRKAVEMAGLEGVSLHTLRHSFASVALELEYSELTVAGLLGHRAHSVTSRYTHHLDRALVTAANRVANLVAARMCGTDDEGAKVMELVQLHN